MYDFTFYRGRPSSKPAACQVVARRFASLLHAGHLNYGVILSMEFSIPDNFANFLILHNSTLRSNFFPVCFSLLKNFSLSFLNAKIRFVTTFYYVLHHAYDIGNFFALFQTCAPSQSKSDKAVKSVAAESKQQALNSNGKVKNLPSVPPEAAAIQCSDASGAEMGSKLVEKLKHLDNEISRYRSENNAIAQLRKQREQVRTF